MALPKILVTGATGKTGLPVALQLRERGVPVRAVIRQRDARSERLEHAGAEIVVANLLDAARMRTAMQGTRRAYFLPPFVPEAMQAASIFADAAVDTGLESIVGLGQWLASPNHPAWLTRQLWQMDRLFEALPGVAYTAISPPFFADIYLRLIGFAAHLGVLPSLTGDSCNAPPSNEDIAAVAVASLLDPAAHGGRRYCPTGPRLLSTRDMAAVLTRVLGRRVRAVEMPMWLFQKAARLQGVADAEMSGFRYWVQDHQQGAFSFHSPTSDLLQVTGRPPEDFETIARRYAALPEARRSLAATARAWADFMRTPISPGYDFDRFDSEPGLAPPPAAKFAMQDDGWRAVRAAQVARPLMPAPLRVGEAA